jgi:hypothetical protein
MANRVMAMNGHWLIIEFIRKETLTEYLLTGLFAIGNLIKNGTKWKDAALVSCISLLDELIKQTNDTYVQSEAFNILVNISLKKIQHVTHYTNPEFLQRMVSELIFKYIDIFINYRVVKKKDFLCKRNDKDSF